MVSFLCWLLGFSQWCLSTVKEWFWFWLSFQPPPKKGEKGNDPQEAQVSPAGTFRTLPDSLFRVGLQSHGRPFWIVLAHKSLVTFGSELRESFGGLAQRITSSLLSLGVPSHILYREPPIMYTYIYIYMKPTQNYQTNFLCHVFFFAHPHTVFFFLCFRCLGNIFL